MSSQSFRGTVVKALAQDVGFLESSQSQGRYAETEKAASALIEVANKQSSCNGCIRGMHALSGYVDVYSSMLWCEGDSSSIVQGGGYFEESAI